MPSENKKKRNVVSCPPKLQEYIDLANYSERELDYYDCSISMKRSLRNQGIYLTDKEVIERFQKQFKNAPERFKDFIFEPIRTFSGEKKNFNTADARLLWLIERKFSTFVSVQQILIRMAIFLFEADDGRISAYQKKDPTEFSTSVSIYIDENGFFRTEVNELFNLINETKITAKRLRICFICGNIFWAKRIDAYSCQKSCANAFRQKLWRARNREEYNERRRANREYKKKVEKMKTNKKEK